MSTTTMASHVEASLAIAPPSTSPPRQQCWECLRRRWVCDASAPVCNKCRAAGIVCPGYSDRKPLTWLAPGRVTSRNRRPRAPKVSDKATEATASGSSSTSAKDGSKSARKESTRPAAAKPRARASPDRNSESHSPKPTAFRGTTGKPRKRNSATSQGSRPGELTFAIDIQPTVDVASKQEELPEYWPPQWNDQWAIDPIPSPSRDTSNVSSQWLEGLSWEMNRDNMDIANSMYKQEGNTVFVPPAIRLEICDFFEAAEYFNEYIYPPLAETQLVPNPYIGRFTALEYMPPSIRHSLISLVISYRILEMPRGESLGTSLARIGPGPVTGPAARLWWRLHHHMGLAIRYLNEDIRSEETHASDVTIVGVYIFLLSELHNTISPHWRVHIDGYLSLIAIRGGFVKLLEEAPHHKLSMLSFTVICIIANTTGPPEDQIAGIQHFDIIDAIGKLYATCVFPTLPCPLPLFLSIIRINYVRHQVARDPSVILDGTMQAISSAILDEVFTFSPEAWVASLEIATIAEVLLVARLFKSSVALYALATLPVRRYNDWSADSLIDPEMGQRTDTVLYHYTLLMKLLRQALPSTMLERSLIWPVIVAGVFSAQGTPADRKYVEENLSRMANKTGGYLLVAKWALERFWESKNTSWEACFHKQIVLLC